MLKVNRETLSRALSMARLCLETKGTIPALAFALFEQKNGKLTITGTDLDVTLRTTIEAEGENVSFGVSARELGRLVGLFEGETVSLEPENWVTVKCGRSKYKLPMLARDAYPNIEDVKARHFLIKGDMLKKILERTVICTSTEESRYTLQGVLLKTERGKLHAVATDQHRLALMKYPIPFSEEVSGLIPRKAATVLRKVLSDDQSVAVTIGDEAAKFEQEDTVIQTRLLIGTFPNYEMIIPKQREHSITLSSDLLRVLKRGAVTADGVSGISGEKVLFSVAREGLEIKTQNADHGEGVEEVPVPCPTLNGESVPLSFNSVFLTDLLQVEPEVEMSFNDNNSQFLLKPTGAREYEYQYVFMSCRI